MTAPFDWAGLMDELNRCHSYVQVATHLRTRIEAAFVPVERYEARNRMWAEQVLATNEATARVMALEQALRKIATVDEMGLAEYTPQAMVITARQALGGEHE